MSNQALIYKADQRRRPFYLPPIFVLACCALLFFCRNVFYQLTIWGLPRTRILPPEAPELPPPLSRVVPPFKAPVYNFTTPHLVSFYEDRLPGGHTKLYLPTSGITMDYSNRKLTAAGCMVGRDIYPKTAFKKEVLICEIPRTLQVGEKIVPVLWYDDEFRRQERESVTLITDLVVQLLPGDFTRLPDDTVLHGNLASLTLSDFRLARSNHKVGPSDNFDRETAKFRPRYQVCQMTMVAPNSHMLSDWANYHRRIGVDMVYIFDNGASLDLKKVFEGRPDIEVVSWPYHKSQTQTVSAFLFMARARCELVFMHDSDEYMMFGLGDGSCLTTGERPIMRYAREVWRKGFRHYKLLYLNMANSGFVRRPQGEVPMNYIHRKSIQHFKNGKSVCLTDGEIWDSGSIHNCGYRSGYQLKIYSEDIKKWGDVKMTPEEVDDPPFLLHFRERSWEEWIEKWDAGRVSGKQIADPKAGVFTIDNPSSDFITVHPEMEYTHFRNKIYTRVMKEGRADEQVIVQTKNGKRCEMLYRLVGNSIRGPIRERCE